ncbi:MAG TPA: 2-oxoglutarate dehydrogenase E1 component [Bdellovibrionota bacterium]|nr:2-oxoglutarate dehydrogenase E1 component [Bdellovibrionota bacterium]
MEKFSYLQSATPEYLEELQTLYNTDPEALDASWRYFFDGFELARSIESTQAARGPQPSRPLKVAEAPSEAALSDEAKVIGLIAAYREKGILLARLDPLPLNESSVDSAAESAAESGDPLALSNFGLSDDELDRTFSAGNLVGLGQASLREIVSLLRDTYCRTIGVEFMHVPDSAEREWLQSRMESSRNREALSPELKRWVLKRLTEAEGFERFLHSRYVAQKRFSLEGSESVLTALDCMIETGAGLGAREFVIGMAHRGRLNVLTNVFNKYPEYIFTEFEGNYAIEATAGEGDVKYHLGYSAEITSRAGQKLHLSMASNPSHLEHVNPVIAGIARAKQDRLGDRERAMVIPITIHGDAAFAGQGVVYETLSSSQVDGYRTGGTLRLIINNQIGFTAEPAETRSTRYVTDGAKMLGVPIFHVNGDDPEAVWSVTRLCVEYRQRFKKDAIIDLFCYRKHGHNEGDEPSFTQPVLYRRIKSHPSVRERYSRVLTAEGTVSDEQVRAMEAEISERFSEAQRKAKAEAPHPGASAFGGNWKGFRFATHLDLFKAVKTGVPSGVLREIAERLNRVPDGFRLHPKLARFFEGRLRAVRDGKYIDWGNAEALAYASLVHEGTPVRLSGQDTQRGTFTHRHAVLKDHETGAPYIPHEHVREGQARFEVYNSILSENGVLGFEFGYSLADPRVLVVWEAQFGDFSNSAQPIIDQFISSGESKWRRSSGLVMLLPHGYEGQGPEHSSGRIERFLQLAAKDNLIVCNLSTPAQFFHLIRRQMLWDFRKPLIVMSPKSLLRHPRVLTTLEELSEGSFSEVLDDSGDQENVRTVLLCSGKVYYDLLIEREAGSRTDLGITRIEQLYPWPEGKLAEVLARYPKARIVWVQEEPRNMGAWPYVFALWSGGSDDFGKRVGNRPIAYIGREAGAAPAVGSAKQHDIEQKRLIAEAFNRQMNEDQRT